MFDNGIKIVCTPLSFINKWSLEINLFKSLNILSSGFSIEVETMAKLVLRDLKIEEVKIRYKRRTANEGKKVKLSDSWDIIYKMFTLRFL